MSFAEFTVVELTACIFRFQELESKAGNVSGSLLSLAGLTLPETLKETVAPSSKASIRSHKTAAVISQKIALCLAVRK
jgi:hypothetical protein